jgi:hypothetical protein
LISFLTLQIHSRSCPSREALLSVSLQRGGDFTAAFLGKVISFCRLDVSKCRTSRIWSAAFRRNWPGAPLKFDDGEIAHNRNRREPERAARNPVKRNLWQASRTGARGIFNPPLPWEALSARRASWATGNWIRPVSAIRGQICCRAAIGVARPRWRREAQARRYRRPASPRPP